MKVSSFAYALATLAFAAFETDATPKQNILFIVPDDLTTNIGELDDPISITPNIDKLYQNGAGFINHHVGKSDCAPSRLAIFSGRRIDSLKVWDFEPFFRKYNPKLVTFPQVFRKNGYTTAAVGKIFDLRSFYRSEKEDLCVKGSSRECSWDYTINQVTLTERSEELCGAKGHSTPGFEKKGNEKYMYYVFGDEYLPHSRVACVTTHAINKLEELADTYIQSLESPSTQEKPFFLAVGYMATHMSWVVPQSVYSLYNQTTDDAFMEHIPATIRNIKPFFSSQSQGYGYPRNREIQSYSHRPRHDGGMARAYYASTTFLDNQIGRLLEALNNLDEKVSNNTIIALWSDNGFHLGDHGLWGKKTHFDGSTKTPLVFVPSKTLLSQPEYQDFKVGVKYTTPVQEVDVFPTLLELAGLADVSNQKRAGVSLLPILRGNLTSIRFTTVSQYWAFNAPSKKIMGYSFRTEQYKYITYLLFIKGKKVPYNPKYRRGKRELYDYSEDGKYELINRANDRKYASVVKMFERFITENHDMDWTNTLVPPIIDNP